jgi:hypothetical protein
MTVDQALCHRWFTNRCNASYYTHLYRRAIKAWYPRPEDDGVIEKLSVAVMRSPSTPLVHANSVPHSQSAELQESRHFLVSKKRRDSPVQTLGGSHVSPQIRGRRSTGLRDIYSIPNTEEHITDDEDGGVPASKRHKIRKPKGTLYKEPENSRETIQIMEWNFPDSPLPRPKKSLTTSPASTVVDPISSSRPTSLPYKLPAEPTYFNPNQSGLKDLLIPGFAAASSARRPKKRQRTELQFRTLERGQQVNPPSGKDWGDGFEGQSSPFKSPLPVRAGRPPKQANLLNSTQT